MAELRTVPRRDELHQMVLGKLKRHPREADRSAPGYVPDVLGRFAAMDRLGRNPRSRAGRPRRQRRADEDDVPSDRARFEMPSQRGS